MRSLIRGAALGLGLAFAGSFTSLVSTAEAQSPAPRYSTPTVRYASAYVPATPRYMVAPGYRHQDGYFQMLNGAPHAGYTRHYGYSSARRPNETYKPWLNRD